MKNPTSKLLALLLSVVLVLSLLPAVWASEDELRDTVVLQTQSIMDILWTKQKRNARASADFEAMQTGGVRPTIYYESTTMSVPYKGVPVSSKGGSLEAFVTELNSGNAESIVKGIPHLVLEDYNDYVGMDMNSFLVDIVSRVSADAPTSVKDALTHKSMVSLAGAVDSNAVDSKSAADPAAVKAAYSQLKKGDILLAWNDNADVGIASNNDSPTQVDYPKVSVLVVKEVNGDQVTVMYAGYHQPEWHFTCSKCGAASTELTYRFPRAHSYHNKYGTWKNFITHKETYPDSNCNGTWKGLYATTWRTETVSFDQLIGGPAGSNVPYGSDSTYLPYTLAVYSAGTVKADVKATPNVDASAITGGFSAKVTSNYRIVGFEAVLTSASGLVQRFPSAAADWKSWSVNYKDPALDQALMETKSGNYKLELFVQSGLADPATGKIPTVSVLTMDFSLDAATLQLSADKTGVSQGDTVTVTLKSLKDGITDFKTAVDYDPIYFDFDEARSKAASPNITFTNDVDMTSVDPMAQVNVRYAGSATKAGSTPVKLYFTAKRTGLYSASDVSSFKMLFLQTSTTAGATDDQLVADRADGLAPITVGFNTVLYKNYAGDNDLLLVFVSNDYEALVKKTELPMMYNNILMEEVTQARYHINENRYLVCFGTIGKDLDPMNVSMNEASDATMSPEIEYSDDVNMSGFVDVADAQAIMNIANGQLPLDGNVTKWLRADINRDGKVDAKDRDALINSLMN